jgi:hypothetical protein
MVSPRRSELALSVATADRVSALLPIFLGRLDAPYSTDTFDPKQGVGLRWRELSDMTQPNDLIDHINAELPALREKVRASGRPGAAAATTALDVIGALLDEDVDELERISRIAGLALRVAAELDHESVVPPEGQRTWVAFELWCQADTADLLAGASDGFSPEFLDEFRYESGRRSMAYRNGMKAMA